jgi:type I restriction enzyme, S subunit
VFRITSPCWPSDNTLILCSKEQTAFEYLFFQLKRIDFTSLNRGSTQPLLTQTDLKSHRILSPPSELLQLFHVVTKRLNRRIDEADIESSTLVALRDTLLPKLISGELRMKGQNN